MNRVILSRRSAARVICPTHVGMNPSSRMMYLPLLHLPHARGDEPLPGPALYAVHVICPTHVGMNRA